jgi:UDP-perosamine 4-acetyltransferase
MDGGPVVVLGAGGHAKVVIEILRACGHEVTGILDADPAPRTVVGAPVIGGDELLPKLRSDGVARAFVALGGNGLRLKLGRLAQGLGFELVNAVHPGAVLSPSVRLGVGVAVMAGAVVNAESRIDDLAVVNTRAGVDHDGVIGEAAHVAPGCALAGEVTVGARAFLGAGVTAVPGVTVGEGAVVGAGACIVRDIEAGVLALGVPARTVRRLQG